MNSVDELLHITRNYQNVISQHDDEQDVLTRRIDALTDTIVSMNALKKEATRNLDTARASYIVQSGRLLNSVSNEEMRQNPEILMSLYPMNNEFAIKAAITDPDPSTPLGRVTNVKVAKARYTYSPPDMDDPILINAIDVSAKIDPETFTPDAEIETLIHLYQGIRPLIDLTKNTETPIYLYIDHAYGTMTYQTEGHDSGKWLATWSDPMVPDSDHEGILNAITSLVDKPKVSDR